MKPQTRTRLLLILIMLMVGALACQTVMQLPELFAAETIGVPEVNPPAPLSVGDLAAQQDLLVALYERASPGVVAILNYSSAGGGMGSGFVWDTEGHIITNFHVIENASTIEVDFPSGFKARAEVVGTDLDSDLAVLKVDAPLEELHPLLMGDSEQIKIGQTVVAIGNPFGLNGTMTVGIVSGLGRTMASLHEAPSGGIFTAGDIIQTDAAINPGNSGGPLLNLNGEVVGVNRAIRTNSVSESGEPLNSGVGFAISINIVKRVVPSLIEKGFYDYPYLGITSLSNLSLLQQESLGLPRSTGAYVLSVIPGGPADDAGLQAGTEPSGIAGINAGGDLIIAADGRPLLQFGDLLRYLLNYKSPGDTIVLTVLRGNQELDLVVVLGSR